MSPFQVKSIQGFASEEKVAKYFTVGEISLLKNCFGTSLNGKKAYILLGILYNLHIHAFGSEEEVPKAKAIISEIRL